MTTAKNNSKTPRNSYTFASKADNHPLARVNAVISKLSHDNAKVATQLALVAVAIENDILKEADVVKLNSVANTAQLDAAQLDAVIATRDFALTILGAHAFADKVLPLFKKLHSEITAITFKRTSAAKTAKYEIVATVNSRYDVHMTCNSTAALDMRKIERDYQKKRANALARAAKREEQDAARAAKRERQAQKRASKRDVMEQKRQLRLMLNELTADQLQQLQEFLAA